MIRELKCKALNNEKFMIESYDQASDVVRDAAARPITDMQFHDQKRPGQVEKGWTGVSSYEEAVALMESGYQPSVDKLKASIKANVRGQVKRTQFYRDVCGFNPIVPLAIQGVPECMLNSRMTQIKAKVVDVYYDMTANCGVDKKEIMDAGAKVLGAIMELEMQGYRFNLYAVQSYFIGGEGCDMLVVKVKSASQPVDLKRISFPLTHTAFLRVIGFDWYSRTPKGKHRNGYGRSIGYEFDDQHITAGFKEMFGKNAVAFSASKIITKDSTHIKEVLTNAK